MMFKGLRTRYLAAATITIDLTILLSIVPLERSSILAIRQNASTTVLLELLIGNLVLLGLVFVAMATNASLIGRFVRKVQGGDHAP